MSKNFSNSYRKVDLVKPKYVQKFEISIFSGEILMLVEYLKWIGLKFQRKTISKSSENFLIFYNKIIILLLLF